MVKQSIDGFSLVFRDVRPNRSDSYIVMAIGSSIAITSPTRVVVPVREFSVRNTLKTVSSYPLYTPFHRTNKELDEKTKMEVDARKRTRRRRVTKRFALLVLTESTPKIVNKNKTKFVYCFFTKKKKPDYFFGLPPPFPQPNITIVYVDGFLSDTGTSRVR